MNDGHESFLRFFFGCIQFCFHRIDAIWLGTGAQRQKHDKKTETETERKIK